MARRRFTRNRSTVTSDHYALPLAPVSHIRHHFDSVDEFTTAPFVNSNNAARCHREFYNNGRWLNASHDYHANTWFGAPSKEIAAARVTKGWVEGAQRVLDTMSTLDAPTPISVRRKLARAEQGDELDVHAVYRGDLDHAWTTRRRRQVTAPRNVRIVVQLNLLAVTSSDELFWRGAAMVKLSDALVESGYNVEIIGAIASDRIDSQRCDYLISMVLKEFRSQLDTATIAGVACNAGFHRLYGFKAYDVFVPWDKSSGDAQGCASDTTGRIINEARLNADGTPTFVTPYDINDKETAEAWITECIKKLDSNEQQVA